MSDLIPESPAPQFKTAEYAGSDRCAYCHLQVVGSYYRVNGAMTCAACAEKIKSGAPVAAPGAYARALFFGICTAIFGMILYSAFAIITGWMIGYVSLAVGYLIAKAMMKGSGGIGGRRFQIAAVLLTYCAVSVSAIPIAIAQQIKKQKEHQQVITAQQNAQPAINSNQAAQPGEADADAESATEPADQEQHPEAQPSAAANSGAKATPQMTGGAIVKGLAFLLVIGLASPFLELTSPVHGLIGLVILFVGLQIAWRVAAGKPVASVDGPF
jgi:hypothetical protein